MEPGDYGSVEADIELYDEDILTLKSVLNTISQSIGKRRNIAGFEQEIIERFGEAGFVVHVSMYEGQYEGGGEKFVSPQITIIDRVQAEDLYDHGKQAHQVQTNILGRKDQPEVDRGVKVAMGSDKTREAPFYRSKGGVLLPGSAKTP